jgi:hypothetical protein
MKLGTRGHLSLRLYQQRVYRSPVVRQSQFARDGGSRHDLKLAGLLIPEHCRFECFRVWLYRLRVANTSCAGVLSPLQLISRGADSDVMENPSFAYSFSILSVR